MPWKYDQTWGSYIRIFLKSSSKWVSHFFYNLKNNLKDQLTIYSFKISHYGLLKNLKPQGFLSGSLL